MYIWILQSSYQDSGEEQGAYNDVGSFPKDFGYMPFDGNECAATTSSDEQKPRILLMGLRRSGKSSIQKVVFHKMSPNETLFLESTNKIVKDDINNSSFVQVMFNLMIPRWTIFMWQFVLFTVSNMGFSRFEHVHPYIYV